ncbi:MAG: hypothetical protein ABIT01_19880 [Thermoanaerobaculia bacterium]
MSAPKSLRRFVGAMIIAAASAITASWVLAQVKPEIDRRALQHALQSMEIASWQASILARTAPEQLGSAAEVVVARMDGLASTVYDLHEQFDRGAALPSTMRIEVGRLRKEAAAVQAVLVEKRWTRTLRPDWLAVVAAGRAVERSLTPVAPRGRTPDADDDPFRAVRPESAAEDAAATAHHTEAPDSYHPSYRPVRMTSEVRTSAMSASHELYKRTFYVSHVLRRGERSDDEAGIQFIERLEHFVSESKAFHESLEAEWVDVNSIGLALFHLREDAGVLDRQMPLFASPATQNDWRVLSEVLARLTKLLQ